MKSQASQAFRHSVHIFKAAHMYIEPVWIHPAICQKYYIQCLLGTLEVQHKEVRSLFPGDIPCSSNTEF